jgi:hypothetical protein
MALNGTEILMADDDAETLEVLIARRLGRPREALGDASNAGSGVDEAAPGSNARQGHATP